MPMAAFLDHLGLFGADVFELEWCLTVGEGALIAQRAGLPVEDLQDMTFQDYVPDAWMMIARKNRHHCPHCPRDVHWKAAAFPWAFGCAVHSRRYKTSVGVDLANLFGQDCLAVLDRYLDIGATRLQAWAQGEDQGEVSPTVMLDFLATRHRRSSPPSVTEQPRMSLQARHDNHAFLIQPIIRQALLVVVPEYDRVAPVLVKPVRPGLHSLAQGSLLQAYALATGIGRLTENPVDTVIDVFLASDAEGERRLRVVLKHWPLSLRRRLWARLWRARDAQRDSNARQKIAQGSQSHHFRHTQSRYYRYGVSQIPYEKRG